MTEPRDADGKIAVTSRRRFLREGALVGGAVLTGVVDLQCGVVELVVVVQHRFDPATHRVTGTEVRVDDYGQLFTRALPGSGVNGLP